MNYSFYDEMDELNEILEETTEDETFLETMMDLLGFNDPKYGVYTEKSHIQRALDRFKKRYDYDSDTGTISVDGKLYKVDIDINHDYICVKTNGRNIWKVRETGVDPNDNSKIILDKDFFKLKNGRRRNTVLQHDIAHSKLHTTKAPVDNEEDTPIDKTKMSNEVLKYNALRKGSRVYRDYIRQGKSPSEAQKQAVNVATAERDNDNAKKYREIQKLNMNKDAIDEREKTFKHARKLADDLNTKYNNGHLNGLEIEADRYAANKSNEREVKRGLRENSKHKSTDKAIRDLDKKTYNAKMMTATNFDPKEKFEVSFKHPVKPKRLSAKLQRKISDTTDRAKNPYDIDAQVSAVEIKKTREKDPRNRDPKENPDRNKKSREILNQEVRARTKALEDPEMRNSKSLK